MPLTDREVRNAKPESTMYRMADGNSLFLQIDPKGGKYWRFMYRYAKKQKTLALGIYPEVSISFSNRGFFLSQIWLRGAG